MLGKSNKKTSLTLSFFTKIKLIFLKILKNDTKALSLLLKIVPGITIVNVIMLSFDIPFAVIPFSLISCLRITLGIFFDNSVYYLTIIPFTCIAIFVSSISIKKGKLLFPALAFGYFIFEFIITLFCTATDLYYFSFAVVMAVAALIDALIVFLLGRYLIKESKKRKQSRTGKTPDN